MKLLLIIARSDFGGGPRHVAQLVKKLPLKYEIYMAYPKEGDPYAKIWNKDKRIKGYCEIPYRKFSFSSLFRLVKFIRRHNITIVHSHGQGAGVYSRLLKILVSHIKVVHTFHGIADDYSSKLKKVLSLVMNKLLRFFTDDFICVSKGEKKTAMDLGYINEYTTKVIYNGIESRDYIHTSKKDDLIRIITLSRFDYQKNMEMAYQIAKRFIGNDKLKFIWVGDGEDKAFLQQKAINEHVDIIEFVGFSSITWKYLAESDVYLSTSRFEGLPYALIEACETGLPIVATDVKGNNEVCIDEYNGELFKNVEEGVNSIKKIIADFQLREKYSKNSYRLYQEKFTIDQMIDSLIEIYRRY